VRDIYRQFPRNTLSARTGAGYRFCCPGFGRWRRRIGPQQHVSSASGYAWHAAAKAASATSAVRAAATTSGRSPDHRLYSAMIS